MFQTPVVRTWVHVSGHPSSARRTCLLTGVNQKGVNVGEAGSSGGAGGGDGGIGVAAVVHSGAAVLKDLEAALCAWGLSVGN